MSVLAAPAKINLAHVVGPMLPGGKHEVATVLQRIDLADLITLEPAPSLRIQGFAGDTLVTRALQLLAEAAGVAPDWSVTIDKRIPVAAGLGGGSSDAAAALRLANEGLGSPLPQEALHALAAGLGADVPFFLREGAQLGEGDGSELTPLDLPRDHSVLVLLPDRTVKQSTAAVYAAFDDRKGAEGYAERRARLLAALAAGDLATLPKNDLASSPLSAELEGLGAFRADVTGAGPAVYGLFRDSGEAQAAAERFRNWGRAWVAAPAW